jgi:Polyketide cyclase / dehydrase and lipid transport
LAGSFVGAWADAAESDRIDRDQRAAGQGVGRHRQFPGYELAPTGEGANTPDAAKRELDLGGGAVIDEELYKYDAEKHSYSYRITKVDVKVLPVNNYSSTIDVVPSEDGKKSTVEWHGAFYRGYPNNDPPPELSDEAAIKAVTAVYKAGLESLKKKVEATD